MIMIYIVQGKIASIEAIKTLENGAKVVNYIVDETNDKGYTTKFNIGMYKGQEYAEHVENFVKYNKVGDEVEVEFTIRSTEYNGKIYNNLNHWKINKLGTTPNALVTSEASDDGLPF
jgi:hypothetical protein